MKRLISVLAVSVAGLFAVPATAHEGHSHTDVIAASHGNNSCADWASKDGYHPNAPASYSSYNCVISFEKKYAQVNGRGKYSGTLHHVKIEATHFDCWPFGVFCNTRYHVYAHWHG